MDENTHPGTSPERRRAHHYHSALPRLQEATASDTNARHPAVMSATGSLKHRASGRTLSPAKSKIRINGIPVPEPTSKRKTLVDRAGEIPGPPQAPSTYSRSVNGAPAYSAYGSTRNTSFTSSTSSRMTSASSRTASSNSSIAMKPPASGTYRPASALSLNKNPLQASGSGHRPATSVDGLMESKDSKRKCTSYVSNTSFPLSGNPSSLNVPRQRPGSRTEIYIARTGRAETPTTVHTGSSGTMNSKNSLRDLSISASMERLSLDPHFKNSMSAPSGRIDSPSKIPAPVAETPLLRSKRSRKSISPLKEPATPGFLTKSSNTPAVWDTKGRLDDMEKCFGSLKEQMELSTTQKTTFEETLDLYKLRLNELEAIRSQTQTQNSILQGELEGLKVKLNSITVALEEGRRMHSLDVDDLKRKHRNEVDDMRSEHRREDEARRVQAQEEVDNLRRQHALLVSETEQRLKGEAEEERSRRLREVEDMQSQLSFQRQTVEQDASSRERQEQRIRAEIEQLNATVESERKLNAGLREKLNQSAAQAATLESSLDAAKAKTHFLESDSQAQSQAFADLNARMQQAIESAAQANEKLRAEETLRRKLHNQIQELKGNIRVFCRVRPTLAADAEEAAKLSFPDADGESKELVVTGPEAKSAIGTDRTSKHSFAFDHVFGPTAHNPDVFEEISQLVQSALDGYNVCIFCYGQTGSGKTHTMSSSDGMIPLAVQQIYKTASDLEERGWRYNMEGSFVEVYNENLNDLLGKASELDKKKLDIKHDIQRGKTTITDVTTVQLDSPDTVTGLLERAASNRSVAATKANERSSRSHSVFILKLEGENSVTGERSEGTLNLVDLAGSERLAHSGATGERLKETQNINKSLSSLGDVIAALGQGKEGAHIPYRNSKLTYLLQQSLGGNSKTLMFVMVSPLQPHLGETITSLKFATKVHNTHIGTAKKQTKARE